MKKENSGPAGFGMPPGRITRARAAAFGESDVLIPSKPPLVKPDRKQTQLGKTKRMASDENNHATSLTSAIQQKKRAVLKDVTNVSCGNSASLTSAIKQKKGALLKDVTNVSCRNSFKGCINAGKLQSKVSQRVKSVPSREKLCSGKEYSTSASLVSIGSALVDGNVKDKMAEEMQQVGMPESQETAVSMIAEESLLAPQKVDNIVAGESSYDTALFTDHIFREDARLIGLIKNDKNKLCEVLEDLSSLGIIDIDSDHTNPQMCSLYSSDIYINLRASELIRRPCSNFMETLQRDINQSMRGILIDWLVEVSEEYRLVPDTLYLTVYIIDRYLSQNYIERHRLQLLGITCMLIASKYEEICAPRVEEFCFITDNTYTKGDVLKMEIQVLNYLGFQLSVPTIKTFLRRFLRAAQASYKVSSLGLGYLANYLAELTLVEYSFLKFVPSVIAASAVFLARWTLERSGNPWNRTLEHYTSYKASDLKATVLAMQELQMNSNKSPLNAIREKYRQAKFESVASMTSPKLLQSHFCC